MLTFAESRNTVAARSQIPNRLSGVLAVADPAVSGADEAAGVGARAAGSRDRSSDRIDVRLQRVRAEPGRIGFAGELRHGPDHVAAGVHQVQLSLQHGDPGLQRCVLLRGRTRQLSPARLDLGLDRCALLVQLLALPAERSRRRRFLRLPLHTRFAGEELGIRARDLECQRHDLVGRLPVRIEDEQIARLRSGLLLSAERAIPVYGLVEDLDDLVAGHDRARLFGARGRLLRRIGCPGERDDARQDSDCNCYAHGALFYSHPMKPSGFRFE